MKRAAVCVFLLAALSGCDDGHHHHDELPLCYMASPGRPLSASELGALEHALDHRLFVDFDNDLSFDNPVGPGRCYGVWKRHRGEWEIDCDDDDIVVNCHG